MKPCTLLLIAAAVLTAASSALGQTEVGDPLEKRAELHSPPYNEVRAEALAWLDAQPVDAVKRQAAEALWPRDEAPAGYEMLERLAATFALGDRRAKQLVGLCSHPRNMDAPLDLAWLDDEATPPLVRNNLRVYVGRWLSHERLYDESLAVLEPSEPSPALATSDVVDPASLLFYRSVAHHRLLHKTDGLAAIQTLLEEVADAPRRYVSVAGLMQDDLRLLEDDSLDHISRRMDDIVRRLDLARAGTRVREIEDGVVDSLDKLIEELEKQKQSGGSSSNSGAQQPSSPMQDSSLPRMQAAGDVEQRAVDQAAGWGNLPPKEREAALQQIGKDFPSHYRAIIEQYFKKLAQEEGQPQ